MLEVEDPDKVQGRDRGQKMCHLRKGPPSNSWASDLLFFG